MAPAAALFPPRLCAPTRAYALAARCGAWSVNWGRRFDKRFKEAHRFTIADTRGPLTLTVPIAKPATSGCTWGDIAVSTHGQWWDVHRVALESAYGRTPYFEFYIDDLLPMLTAGVADRYPLLRSLSAAWDGWICRVLGIPAPAEAPAIGAQPIAVSPGAPEPPYWQVRADRLGFLPGLSVLDLIFSLGPEASLYLDRLR